MNHLLRTLLSGLILLLPLVITFALVAWLGNFIIAYIGPYSIVGRMLTTIGLGFSASQIVAYAIGVVILLLVIYVLGLIVESRLRSQFSELIDSTMRRIPLVSNVYTLTKRFVAIMDQKDTDGLKSMSPVWCFFGGEGGAAVLALLPSPKPFKIGDELYHAILVPSAPVPVGGGLVYVPVAWVKAADIGVEGLMSVYVSMGVAPPARTPALAGPDEMKPDETTPKLTADQTAT